MVHGEHVLILVVIPLLTVAIAVFLNRTKYGIAVRASAANADAARLAGISVRRMSSLVWVIAGVLAAIATILSAPITTTTSGDVLTLGPGLLVRVLVAAVIARMVSPSIAVVTGIAIGVGEAVLYYNRPNDHGILDLALLIVLLLALIPLARRGVSGRIEAGWSFAPRLRAVPGRGRAEVGQEAPAGGLCRCPAGGSPSACGRPRRVPAGAVEPGAALRHRRPVADGAHRLVGPALARAGGLRRGRGHDDGCIGQPRCRVLPALAAAAAVGCLASLVVGAPALRIPGMFLAVTTLAFAVATGSWLLSRSIFVGSDQSARLPRAVIGSFSLAPQRTVLHALLPGRPRRHRPRRCPHPPERFGGPSWPSATTSVRSPPSGSRRRACKAHGLCHLRHDCRAGGRSARRLVRDVRARPLWCRRVAAGGGHGGDRRTGIGHRRRPRGRVRGRHPRAVRQRRQCGAAHRRRRDTSACFCSSPAVSPRSSPTGAIGSSAVLRVGLPKSRRRSRRPMHCRRRPSSARARPRWSPLGTWRGRSTSRGLTVRFGGPAVVDDVDLHVDAGEIVGLIGSNGAGKSTVMNAIGGFVRSEGTLSILGQDVTTMAAARRSSRSRPHVPGR